MGTADINKADLEIQELDDDKRQVFGWASVAKLGDTEVIDSQGDAVDIEELERAVYDFVVKSRIGGDTHVRVGVSEMIESMVFTPEKITKLGLDESAVPHGWWVGFHVTDDQVWKAVKEGRRRAFSVGGTGYRTPIEAAADVAKAAAVHVHQYTRSGKKVRAHERGKGTGAVSAPTGMGMFSSVVQQAIEAKIENDQESTGYQLDQGTLVGRLTKLWGDSYSRDRRSFTNDSHWYTDASLFGRGLANLHGTSHAQSVGILAALSPQTAWGRNKEMAHSLMGLLRADPAIKGRRLSEMGADDAAGVIVKLAHPSAQTQAGLPMKLFYQSKPNLSKAIGFWRGGDPSELLGNGPKVRNFYNNLLAPDRASGWTDDTHMRRIWTNDPSLKGQGTNAKVFRQLFGTAPSLKKEGYSSGWGTYPWYADAGYRAANKLGVMPHQVQAVTWTEWRRQNPNRTGDSDANRGYLDQRALLGTLGG